MTPPEQGGALGDDETLDEYVRRRLDDMFWAEWRRQMTPTPGKLRGLSGPGFTEMGGDGPCQKCIGWGWVLEPSQPCPSCGGTGRLPEPESR